MAAHDCSLFEGTEKKVELIIDPDLPAFRSYGDERWRSIVRSAGADVVSKISNHCCDAYLLSESSLFVFDHKLVIMTCGRTTLCDAVLGVLSSVSPDKIRMLFYERKNEVFPHDQPTSFLEDARVLRSAIPGRAYQFGDEDEHHLYLFHLDRPFDCEPTDMTVEVLMYGIDVDVRKHFSIQTHAATEAVRRLTGVDRILPGFQVDDHLFQPTGYSLNAIRDDEYYTVHVTPQDVSYASFETNHRFADGVGGLVTTLTEAFRPRSFDVITWDQTAEIPAARENGYRLRSQVAEQLRCGYTVRFFNYYRPQEGVERAIELPVS